VGHQDAWGAAAGLSATVRNQHSVSTDLSVPGQTEHEAPPGYLRTLNVIYTLKAWQYIFLSMISDSQFKLCVTRVDRNQQQALMLTFGRLFSMGGEISYVEC